MAKYQKYEEYKDSGVKWLSQLPVGWDVERTKRMLCLRRELVGANSLDYQLLSLTLRGVIPRDISNGDGKIPADFSTYQEVEKKDLIFCLFDIDETPRTVGLSPEKGMITGAYNVYQTSDRCSSRYAYYYFLHIDLRKGLRPFYTGLRKVVRSETFGNIKMPCPSYEEQVKIANFLDHEAAQIDTLIEKQQTLIQLLKEKRQAVISHAVTKGLNPDAPMKDSGVEWLGDVPEHWNVGALKYWADIIDCKHITAEFVEDGYPLASISEVKDWTVNLSSSKFTTEKYYLELIENGRKPVIGDILYSRNATVGEAALVIDSMPDFAMGQDVCLIRLNDKILSEYIMYVLNSGIIKKQLDLAMVGSTFKRINVDNIRNFDISFPSIGEQQEIVEYLSKLLNKFDDLVYSAEKAIQLMQERRTALISAAVTGKIDVRSWVAPDNI